MGLYSTIADTVVSWFKFFPDQDTTDMGGRWDNGAITNVGEYNVFDPGTDALLGAG